MRDFKELLDKIASGEEKASDWGTQRDHDAPTDIGFYDKRTMKFVTSAYEAELAEYLLGKLGIQVN